jgi:CRISPR/Cas system-associated exonuclease Cas4 (RecB family)
MYMSNPRPLFPASYSKLSLYETCPDQLRYRYILGLPSPPGAAAQRGTKLHSSAEGYLLREKTTINKALRPIVKALRETRDNNPLVEHKLAFTRGLEKVVAWESPDAWFRMVLDAAYRLKGTGYVQEWKSGKVYDDHKSQREIYAIGAFHVWPSIRKAVATTHYIDQDQAVPLYMDRERATLLTWHLNHRLEVMEQDKRFGPRPGFYCRWCPYSRSKGGPCKVG